MQQQQRMSAGHGAADIGIQQPAPATRVSIRDLCSLFCCPPFPSSIVSKLAFMPPEPSYKIEYDPETKSEPKIHLLENRAEWPHGADELRNVEIFFTRTRRNNNIACMFIRPCAAAANFTIIFSHGNAVDLGQMCSFYYGLGLQAGLQRVQLRLLRLATAARAAGRRSGISTRTSRPPLQALKTRYNINEDQVILYGQSIGTVPSVDLASNNPNIAALVLHSPLLSGLRVACAGVQRTYCCDAFPSIEKIPRVQCPTLVIHGTEDDVIDFSHGLTIFENCPSSVEPLWVAGAGHNDVELHSLYVERLRVFINNEVPKPKAQTAAAPTANGAR
ncbi:Alpha/beta hydrolase domain-containing protein 17C [Aphelenchoides fujianensis]|nr:Alpha/beta hydrolase domain-containing protein 17C [Aphelenchoides fujianensis]